MEEDKSVPMWKRDNVNAPQHYLHGRKETIDVIPREIE